MASVPYLCGTGGRMIDLPHRGNRLEATCCDCGHMVSFSGRDIVTRFTAWLRFPVADWAATLRCSGCDSRFIRVSTFNDPSADGFRVSTQEGGRIIWARRLNAWLAEVGSDVWAYADVLKDHPISIELENAGLRRFNPDGA